MQKHPLLSFNLGLNPKKPWEKIHLDFAGPFLGKMWLICVDAFSKYPYVTMLNIGQTTSKHTIDALQQIFSFEGLPDTIVSDNGVQFVSREFENFCVKLNIKHLTSPIFHPASNGEAERFVQTFKRSLSKNVEGGKSLIDSVRFVLATYRSSPHPSLDWRTPAELLHGRQPKSLMSLFLPGTCTVCRSKTTDGQNVEKPRISKYCVGDLVFARNYASGAKWFSAVVTKNVGSMMYMVRTDRGLCKKVTKINCNHDFVILSLKILLLFQMINVIMLFSLLYHLTHQVLIIIVKHLCPFLIQPQHLVVVVLYVVTGKLRIIIKLVFHKDSFHVCITYVFDFGTCISYFIVCTAFVSGGVLEL